MTYRTKSGDTWDVIAKEVYGNEYRADVLMAANREHIGTFLFGEGVLLTAPAPEEKPDSSLPPWKTGVYNAG